MPVNHLFAKQDSPAHVKVINGFRERIRASRNAQHNRLQLWSDNEDMLKAYVQPSDNDSERKIQRKKGTPQYTTIEVPYSYAMMLTAHTYMTNVFLSRSPIMQVMGLHGEGQMQEMAVEAYLNYQLVTGGNIPALYVWLLDPLRYGQGVLGHYWDEEIITTTRYVQQPQMFLGMPVPGTEKLTAVNEQVRGYAGVRYFNTRPQDFFTDPNVPFCKFQDGEFCARFNLMSAQTAKQREAAGVYFNVDLALQGATRDHERDMGSPRTYLAGDNTLEQSRMLDSKGKPTTLRTYEYHLKLIPRDYGLNEGTNPEKWVFTIANDTVIGAQPLGMLHNRFPFDVLEYEVGGYELYNRSMLEISKPLNDTISWLFNSHFFNVRKTLNDQFIIDPSAVEIRDLEDPNPGRLVRLKPAAYGKDINQFIKQFPSVDVTGQNINDANLVSELLQRLLGVNDNIMGQSGGGRQTATEVRSNTGFSTSRQKTIVEYWSAMGFAPLTQKTIQLSQQMYDMERKFRIVGNLARWDRRFADVNPEAIAGFYDFVPVDGSLPVDRFAQANLWQQLLQTMTNMPQLMMGYNVPDIFAFVAQLSGLKNIDQFRIQVSPDAQVAANIQAGNAVPIDNSQGGNPVEPGQIPGMGPTG